MKITGVSIKNYLIIKEMILKPNDRFNLFVGKNEQGKTAILRAITDAFKGCKDPSSVIRHGTDKSEILIDLDNGYKIIRKITKNGQNLDVLLNKDGDKKSKPATYVESLLGNHSFNPIALLTAENRTKYLLEAFPAPKVTAEMLRKHGVGDEVIARITLTKDGFQVPKDVENIYYLERSTVNKTINTKQVAYDEAMSKLPEGFDPKTYDVEKEAEIQAMITDLIKKKVEADALIRGQAKNKTLMRDLKERIEADEATMRELMVPDAIAEHMQDGKKMIAEAKEEIRKWTATLDQHERDLKLLTDMQRKREDLAEKIENLNKTLETFEIKDMPDLAAIEKELVEAQTEGITLSSIRVNHEIYAKATTEIKPELDDAKAKSKALTMVIEKMRTDLPAELAKDARIPVKGLRVEGDRIFIGDISLDNLSGEEGVRISLAILREVNKDAPLKVFCVDGIEKLDDEHMEEFKRQVEPGEWQFFATMVIHGDVIPPGATVIEKGAVKGEKKTQNTLF